MYEKDKERYEKEMKKYTSDKVPKEPPVKKPRTKAPKQKATVSATATTKGLPSVSKNSPDERSSLVVSPTLNPLFPQSLSSMPMNIPHIPMPQLIPLAEEGSEFDNYQELHSTPQDSFL